MPKVKLNLSLDDEVARWLKVKAAEKGLSVSELIEEWARERMDEWGSVDDWVGEKRCIYCGRRIEGYGAICAECKREPTDDERRRMAELWRQAKEELDRLIEKWRMERQGIGKNT